MWPALMLKFLPDKSFAPPTYPCIMKYLANNFFAYAVKIVIGYMYINMGQKINRIKISLVRAEDEEDTRKFSAIQSLLMKNLISF